jgi:hypothetical protein
MNIELPRLALFFHPLYKGAACADYESFKPLRQLVRREAGRQGA